MSPRRIPQGTAPDTAPPPADGEAGAPVFPALAGIPGAELVADLEPGQIDLSAVLDSALPPAPAVMLSLVTAAALAAEPLDLSAAFDSGLDSLPVPVLPDLG